MAKTPDVVDRGENEKMNNQSENPMQGGSEKIRSKVV